jgi:putative hemolysin
MIVIIIITKIYTEQYALKILLISSANMLTVVVSGCNYVAKNETSLMHKQSVMPPTTALKSTPHLYNPASKYCIFPDGRECEEWTYFRGECKNE